MIYIGFFLRYKAISHIVMKNRMAYTKIIKASIYDYPIKKILHLEIRTTDAKGRRLWSYNIPCMRKTI